MSDRRYVLAFVAALFVAVLATMGVYRLLDGAASANPANATRDVIVAAHDLAPGTALTAEDVAVMRWPTNAVPSRAHASLDSVIGRVVSGKVVRGEPVLSGQLAPRGASEGLAAVLAPGHRAMAVRVTEASGLSGLVRPGARVDVVATMPDQEGTGHSIARVMISDVRVLTVGAQVDTTAAPNGTPAPIATLEVTPEQAEQLAVVESQGAIQLVLRGYGSADRPATLGATMREVIGAVVARRPTVIETPPVTDMTPVATAVTRRASAATPKATVAATPAKDTTVAAVAEPTGPVVRIYRGSTMEVQRVDSAPRTAPSANVVGVRP